MDRSPVRRPDSIRPAELSPCCVETIRKRSIVQRGQNGETAPCDECPNQLVHVRGAWEWAGRTRSALLPASPPPGL